MKGFGCAWLVFIGVALGGCASSSSGPALDEAVAAYARVKADPDVLRSAPKDVVRAGETLARAERFSSYLGSGEDVAHYAYLSQRYSDIATQHSELDKAQQRIVLLERERDRLRLALREGRMLSSQQENRWIEDQMMSLAASETDRGLVMTLGDVLFETASATLSPSANRTLFKLAQFLQINQRRNVRIEGYSDSLGPAEQNLALSKARAQAVGDLLVDLGIEARRIEVVAYGERFPVAENASAQGRAQNRRVEILFSDDQGRIAPPR
ncbi:hypothetical protein DN820_05010 [Stutzerimonas nosocomialis]|uniref:OmpA-like domain-containing protein n=1 Tax=Stutzerimonas nosocomialis TaxID=1056496 RepID=A0A5R9QHT0_9GAMM|nr:OmpA family protein [Stutzerimonas nosocomialis]TLX64787.1 hypothetical protein DN820_05010 [Stutzerimonas nosocomialis]